MKYKYCRNYIDLLIYINISEVLKFILKSYRIPQSVKDVKMDMSSLDGNGASKRNGCNKSITLKVNPKGNDIKATDGYIETCEV